MPTIQRIPLHEVQHHLAQKGIRARFNKVYFAAADKDAETYRLVCEAVNTGIRAGIYARYDRAPLSKEFK